MLFFQILRALAVEHLQLNQEVNRMKLRTRLLSTVAAIGLSAVALPAAADDFFFDATAVGAFGAPT